MPLRPLLALLVAVAIPMQAFAQPQTLTSAQLTEGSLLGQIQSTAQLQQAFDVHSALIARASEDLGLTHADFVAVRRAITLGQARYVTLPRHLDGMAGQYNGKPFIDRDVIIPPGEHGWEVDLPKAGGMVRVFVPNACGNISYLRTKKRYRVAAAHYSPPIAAPVAAPVAVATPPVAPVTPAPEAIATAVPVAVAAPAMPPAAAKPHLAWLGLLLIPIIVGLSGHGGSSTPSVVPTPAPIHTICPPALIRH